MKCKQWEYREITNLLILILAYVIYDVYCFILKFRKINEEVLHSFRDKPFAEIVEMWLLREVEQASEDVFALMLKTLGKGCLVT